MFDVLKTRLFGQKVAGRYLHISGIGRAWPQSVIVGIDGLSTPNPGEIGFERHSEQQV